VIAVHGSDVFVVSRNRVARVIGHAALRRAREVITCSRDFATRVVALGASPAATTVIPYGVDVLRFAPDGSASQWLTARLGVQADRPVLVAMGRLVHKKGFAVLLAAMPAIISRCPDAVLVIAGVGELCSELAGYSRALHVDDHVLFVGHVPWQETQHYLTGATVVVVPSIVDHAGNVDGLPNVLLEAMACGCAIVASDVAGIPDVVVDGVNGVLVPAQDSNTLAEAIIGLVTSPERRTRLAVNARQTAVSELSWPSIAPRVVRVLSTAAEGKVHEA
jgi:glycosyltransferase involved in cell wall biosynthesis